MPAITLPATLNELNFSRLPYETHIINILLTKTSHSVRENRDLDQSSVQTSLRSGLYSLTPSRFSHTDLLFGYYELSNCVSTILKTESISVESVTFLIVAVFEKISVEYE